MGLHTPTTKEDVLIVGAGVFGLSTALELKKRGYESVTVLDRYLPPVVDGSSVDISRVVRSDYADPLYAKMAREAYDGWTSEYSEFFHRSGFVMLADKPGNRYIEKSLEISQALGASLDVYDEAHEVTQKYPSIPSDLRGLKAYHNPQGGWADAEASIRFLATQCSTAGVSILTGPRGTVVSLRRSGSRVVGVNTKEGDGLSAARVILAAGAWSNRLVDIRHATAASGQPVGFIQLTGADAERLKGMPVLINLSTGVFCFPPTPVTNILKIARHGYGFATRIQAEDGRLVSSPRRDGNNAAASYLPEDADAALREGLRQLLPEFAEHPWMKRRLCWYSDTQQGDFLVDNHPQLEGLFLAAGGAGQ